MAFFNKNSFSVDELSYFVKAITRQEIVKNNQTYRNLLTGTIDSVNGSVYTVSLDGANQGLREALPLNNNTYLVKDYVYLIEVEKGNKELSLLILDRVSSADEIYFNLPLSSRFNPEGNELINIQTPQGTSYYTYNIGPTDNLKKEGAFEVLADFSCTSESGTNYGLKIDIMAGAAVLESYTLDTNDFEGQPFYMSGLTQSKVFHIANKDTLKAMNILRISKFGDASATVTNLTVKSGRLIAADAAIHVDLGATGGKNYFSKEDVLGVEETIELKAQLYHNSSAIDNATVQYYWLLEDESVTSTNEDGTANSNYLAIVGEGWYCFNESEVRSVIADDESITEIRVWENSSKSIAIPKSNLFKRYENKVKCLACYSGNYVESEPIIIYNYEKENFEVRIAQIPDTNIILSEKDNITLTAIVYDKNTEKEVISDYTFEYKWGEIKNGKKEYFNGSQTKDLIINSNNYSDGVHEFFCDVTVEKGNSEVSVEEADPVTIRIALVEGRKLQIVYSDNETIPSKPYKTKSNGIESTNIGSGKDWHENLTDSSIWMCQKVAESLDGDTNTWGSIIQIQGIDGKDGTGVSIKGVAYTKETINDDSVTQLFKLYTDAQTTDGREIITAEPGDAYLVNGYLMVYVGQKDGNKNFQCVGKIKGEKGNDGVGINSTSVSYTTTETQDADLSKATWQSTLPTNIPQGHYLWTRTVTDYTDSTVADTVVLSCARIGEDGYTPVKNKDYFDGTSVKVSSIQYQEGESSTTAPTGAWKDTVVSVAEGKYLWSKTTFSDNTVMYGVAKQGEKGDSGKSIGFVAEYYAVNDSETSAPTSWTWINNPNSDPKPAIPVPNENNRFLWNYEKSYYSQADATSGKAAVAETSPRVMYRYSTDGADGADGWSINTITSKYAVSINENTMPTSWYDSPPTLSSTNRILWNKEIITYTGGEGTKADTVIGPIIIGYYSDSPYTLSIDEDFISVPANAEGMVSTGFTYPEPKVTLFYGSTPKKFENGCWKIEGATGILGNDETVLTVSNLNVGNVDRKVIKVFYYQDSSQAVKIAEAAIELVKQKAGGKGDDAVYIYAIADANTVKRVPGADSTVSYSPITVGITLWQKIGTAAAEQIIGNNLNGYSCWVNGSPINGWSVTPSDSNNIAIVIKKGNDIIDKLNINIVQDGVDGADGKSVAQIKEYYARSKSEDGSDIEGWTEVPGTGSTPNSIPQVNSEWRYLWNYEQTLDGDGKQLSETSPVIIYRYSTDGAPGTPGTSGHTIDKITEYYANHTSGTEAPAVNLDANGNLIPGNTWVSAKATVPIGNVSSNTPFRWNLEEITFKKINANDNIDDLPPKYGTPQCLYEMPKFAWYIYTQSDNSPESPGNGLTTSSKEGQTWNWQTNLPTDDGEIWWACTKIDYSIASDKVAWSQPYRITAKDGVDAKPFETIAEVAYYSAQSTVPTTGTESHDDWKTEVVFFAKWTGDDENSLKTVYRSNRQTLREKGGSELYYLWSAAITIPDLDACTLAAKYQIKNNIYVDGFDSNGRPIIQANGRLGPITGDLGDPEKYPVPEEGLPEGDVGRWCQLYGRTIISGGAIVTGTITADKMKVNSLSAIQANMGSLTAGEIKSPDFKQKIKIWKEETPVSAFTYEKIDSIVTITGYIGDYTDVVIPATIEGYPVMNIGNNAFQNCSSLTSVVIPDSVMSISDRAFQDCSGLTNVWIGKGVKSIGGAAFQNCIGLTNVEIPDNVTSIGNYAFSGCSSLMSVIIGKGVKSIGGWAFQNCSSLTSVVIGEGVTSVGNGVFLSCDGLTVYCGAESQPSGWNSYWDTLNYNNYDKLSVNWGYKAELEIGDETPVNAFKYSIANNEVTITKYVGDYTDVVIPVTIEGHPVTNIGNDAFNNCDKLTSVVIPDSVISIGERTFCNCDSLNQVKLSKCLVEIDFAAFAACGSLCQLVIPKTVVNMGWSVTDTCNCLTVYCEAESKPSGWSDDWNSGSRPVYWYSDTKKEGCWRYDKEGFKISCDDENMIDSKYFAVTKNGEVTASKGDIAGWNIGENGIFRESSQEGYDLIYGLNSDANFKANSLIDGSSQMVIFYCKKKQNDGEIITEEYPFMLLEDGSLYSTAAQFSGNKVILGDDITLGVDAEVNVNLDKLMSTFGVRRGSNLKDTVAAIQDFKIAKIILANTDGAAQSISSTLNGVTYKFYNVLPAASHRRQDDGVITAEDQGNDHQWVVNGETSTHQLFFYNHENIVFCIDAAALNGGGLDGTSDIYKIELCFANPDLLDSLGSSTLTLNGSSAGESNGYGDIGDLTELGGACEINGSSLIISFGTPFSWNGTDNVIFLLTFYISTYKSGINSFAYFKLHYKNRNNNSENDEE